MPTYFIRGASEFDSPAEIRHFDLHKHDETTTENWFPTNDAPVDVVLTSGASCPDALLDEVIRKIVAWFPDARPVEEALAPFEEAEDE